MALKMQSGWARRGTYWNRRSASILCGLALAGAGLLVQPAVAEADQAPAAATSSTTDPLGSLSAELATLESDVSSLVGDIPTALPTTETCVSNLLDGLAIALGHGGTPQPGTPLC